MRNYSLVLVGLRPPSLAEATSSGTMLFAGLEEEFKKLAHVNLSIHDLEYNPRGLEIECNAYKDPYGFIERLPKADFLLIRCYTAHPVVQHIVHARQIKYERCSFIEVPQPTMNYTFAFLSRHNPNQLIDCPYNKEFMINVPKIPKTVLLDDDCSSYSEEGRDISYLIAKWVEELTPEYTFYQLTRDGKTNAEFIKPITMGNYKDYMDRTSTMETFLQVHKGSYEHSIIDMVGRGIRTCIPVYMEHGEYIDLHLIHYLNLPTFGNGLQLKKLLREDINKPEWDNKINKMTEMQKCVEIMDKHFQEVVERYEK